MPATTTTTEVFSKSDFTLDQVEEEKRVRIRAGAVRSALDLSDGTNYLLVTEWNVMGENDPDPVAPVMGGKAQSGPYLAPLPEFRLGTVVGTGQCVPYVQAAARAPLTKFWRRGALVKGNPTIKAGTAIAIFDPNGTYGNHLDKRSHAAIYLSQDNVALHVYDQWLGQPVHPRPIRFGGKFPVDDGNLFYIIA